MAIRTNITNETAELRLHFDFEVKDKRGRTMGAQIITNQVVFAPVHEGVTWGYFTTPGSYYRVRVHTTRNGATYGPIQNSKDYNTEAEVKVEIERYLKQARKAAQRKAA